MTDLDLDPRKHGIDTPEIPIHPEERDEFNALLAGLYHDLMPSGELQRILFGQIVYASWNLRLVRRTQADALRQFGPCCDTVAQCERFYLRNERSLRHALKELRDLQTETAFRATMASEQSMEPAQVPVLVDTGYVQRRVRALYRLAGIKRDAAASFAAAAARASARAAASASTARHEPAIYQSS